MTRDVLLAKEVKIKLLSAGKGAATVEIIWPPDKQPVTMMLGDTLRIGTEIVLSDS